MANLKLSSKMHIMVIVSALVIAIGLAVGLVCQFLAGGFFNYGAEYSSYNMVAVDYAFVDLSSFGDEDGIKDVCDEEFEKVGVSYYAFTSGDTNGGGELVFKFNKNTDEANVKKAAEAIHTRLNTEREGYTPSKLSNAYFHSVETDLGGSKAFVYGSIAVASAMVLQFIYFAIRYKLTMAFSALLANVHNVALFVALAAITRVPLGSSVFTFGALTVLMTMAGCAFLFDKMRKKFKDESFAKLDAFEQVDACAKDSFMSIAFTSVCIAAAAVAVFVLLAISSLSVALIVTPAVLALLGAVASFYGTAFFTPAVYSRFKKIGEDFKANRTPNKKKKKS